VRNIAGGVQVADVTMNLVNDSQMASVPSFTPRRNVAIDPGA